MPTVTIDGRPIDVPEGTTVLDAAAALGIRIPTLCHMKAFEPDPTCFVCVVQVEGRPELSPSCATVVGDGMVVRTDTDDVLGARRAALELMLSDHTGDCVAPCSLACPAHLDIPDFIHEIVRADYRAALATVKRTIALPASLGRICPRFCENVCRRKDLDEPVAICALRRFVADLDVESDDPYVPDRAEPSGKRVVIAGAGPAGLAAAYYLLQSGHACTLLEAREAPGGLFRYGIADWRFRTGTRLGDDVSVDDLRGQFDAVLVATGTRTKAGGAEAFKPGGHTATGGQVDLAFIEQLGLETGPRGVRVDRRTQQTGRPGVFAAGNVTSGPNYGVHAVAAGRRAAAAIDQFLRGAKVTGDPLRVHVVMRDLAEDELARFCAGADPAKRVFLEAVRDGGATRGLSEDEARSEARRCLDCDCGKRDACLLRQYASDAGAVPTRFRGQRRPFRRDATHPDIVYESGKCIQCGRCVRIAEQAREEFGLTFVGRGFTVRTAAPLDETLQAGLRRTALQCAEACPTGALCLRRDLRERHAR